LYPPTNYCHPQIYPNCLTANADNTGCLVCIPGFILDASGLCNPSVFGCIAYDTDANCLTCANGYYLTPENTCAQQSIPNCVLYLANRNLCEACQSPFVVSANQTTCILRPIDHCLTYNLGTGACVDCASGWYAINGVCNPQNITNCQTYVHNQNVCIRCAAGYSLVLGQCLFISVPNCQNLNVDGSCASCNAGYYLINGSCQVQFLPNCAVYVPNRLLCDTCESGYYIEADGRCYPMSLPHCLRYVANQNRCAECLNGYTVTMAGVCIEIIIDDCTIYDGNGTCIQCAAGYYLDNGVCAQQWVPFCIVYFPFTNRCQICQPGYYYWNFECLLQDIPFCAQYAYNFNTCVACQAGYTLRNGQCVGQNIPNCLTYVSNSSLCAQCQPGYILSANQTVCSPANNIPNCQQQTNGTCLVCNTGFYLTNNACVAQNIPFCSVYQANFNLCLTCQTGYYVINGQCFPQSVNNCDVYEPNTNTCLACVPTYSLVNFRCVQDTDVPNCVQYHSDNITCTQCASGFVLNTATNQCVAITIPNCANQTSNLCVSCVDGFYTNGTACLTQNVTDCLVHVPNFNQCSVCDSGFFLTNNTCTLQNIPNCALYQTNQNVCLACASGYVLQANSCVPDQSVPGCLFYQNGTNICTQCMPGFALNSANNTCVANEIENCLNQVLNNCTLCDINYFTTGATCQPQDVPNCLTFVINENLCTFCDFGFYLVNGACFPQNVPNCLEYAPNTNECVECATDYIEVNGTCVYNAPIPNCDVADGQVCVTCSFGYYLTPTGTCALQNVTNCNVYVPNQNNCSACADNFLNVLGVCVPGIVIPNCGFYSDLITCAVCDFGFYLSTNACLPQDIPNCYTYTPNVNVCAFCFDDFLPDVNGVCQYSNLQFCDILIDSNTCSMCIDGYILVNGVCFDRNSINLNCIEFADSSQTFCLVCALNYYLNAGLCIPQFLSNCITYFVNVNQCSFCEADFYPTPVGDCAAVMIANCAAFEGNSNTCRTCVPGFNLRNNYCVNATVANRPANCLIFNSGFCQACEFGFQLSQDLQACLYLSSFSLSFALNATSAYISANTSVNPPTLFITNGSNPAHSDWTFVLHADGNHVLLLTADSQFALVEVNNHLSLVRVNGTLDPTALWSPEYVTSNQFYFKNYVSQNYIEGATSANVLPVPISVTGTGHLTNCAALDSNGITCLRCRSGFSLIDNVCLDDAHIDRPASCISYNSGFCQACRFGFQLSADQMACDFLASFSLSYFMVSLNHFIAANLTSFPPTLYSATDDSNAANAFWTSLPASDGVHVLILTSDSSFVLAQSNGQLVLVSTANIDDSALWSPEYITSDQFYLRNKATGHYLQDVASVGDQAVPIRVAAPASVYTSVCAMDDSNGFTCLACHPGFTLDNNVCTEDSQTDRWSNCLLFSNGYCQACRFGFQLDLDEGACVYVLSYSLSYHNNDADSYLAVLGLATPPLLYEVGTQIAQTHLTYSYAVDGQHVLLLTSNGDYAIVDNNGSLVLVPVASGVDSSAFWSPEYLTSTEFLLRNEATGNYLESSSSTSPAPVPFKFWATV
jgi:hypothetical protein